MAPNENATNTVVEECVALQEALYPSNTKPQIIATGKYGAPVRSKKQRYENWKAIARQVGGLLSTSQRVIGPSCLLFCPYYFPFAEVVVQLVCLSCGRHVRSRRYLAQRFRKC